MAPNGPSRTDETIVPLRLGAEVASAPGGIDSPETEFVIAAPRPQTSGALVDLEPSQRSGELSRVKELAGF